MSEEAILRKFVADGDGWGEDKRILTLFTALRELNQSSGDDDDARIESLLGLCAYGVEKQSVISELMVGETEEMVNMVAEIRAEIGTLRAKIDEVKVELDEARLEKRNKEEYDAKAREILDVPSREETAENLEKLQTSLTDLQETQKELELKLGEKRRQVQQLNAMLNEILGQRPEREPEEEEERAERSPSPAQAVSEDGNQSDESDAREEEAV